MGGVLDALVHLPPWLVLAVAFALPAAEASLLVGVLIPGEAAVLVAGVLAHGGALPLWAVMAGASTGAVLGDQVGYRLGRRYGPALIDRLPRRARASGQLERALALVRRRGAAAVVLGRWTAALRALVPGVAGSSGMPAATFTAANAAGGVAWAVAVSAVGYAAGASYRVVERRLNLAGEAAAAVVVAGLLAAVAVRRYRRRAAAARTVRPSAPAGHAEGVTSQPGVRRAALHGVTARTRVLVSLLVGLVVAVPAALLASPEFAPLVGWDAAAVLYVAWVWAAVWPMDAEATALHARAEDTTRATAELLVLGAAVASLAAVTIVLAGAGQHQGPPNVARIALGVLSVVLAWVVVHTVYTLRYARLYYTGDDGVHFHQETRPDYGDFAYLAFTIGMTFQVSDTDLADRGIRRTALGHALLSFLLVTGILATTINLIAGLIR